MKYEDDIVVFVPSTVLYPQLPNNFSTFKNILQKLNRSTTVLLCSIINQIVSIVNDERYKIQEKLLLEFFNTEQISAINEFAKTYGGGKRVSVFFRGQMLEFIRWIVLFGHDDIEKGNPFDKSEYQKLFIQAALIASEIWGKRLEKNSFINDEDINIAQRRAMGFFRKGVEAGSIMPDPSRSLGRGLTIFLQYFPSHCPTFLNDFTAVTGLTAKEYFLCSAVFLVHMMDSKMSSKIFLIEQLSKSTKCPELFNTYLNINTQKIEELKNALWGDSSSSSIDSYYDHCFYDFRPMREKPIFCDPDGKAILIDPLFFSEMLMLGPLFNIIKHNNQKVNELFGAFGKAFEEYACDILKRMYSEIPGFATRIYYNHNIFDCHNVQYEVDAILDEVKVIMIFEIKCVWLREDLILSENYNDYLEHLRKKYGISSNLHGGRNVKGVGQLARVGQYYF
ncbi:MAG: hypothetical protein AB2L14_12900 [Candidatus Xenobiia bacterium LiM19]